MHQKVNVLRVFFSIIYAQKEVTIDNEIKFDYSLVFSCFHLLFPQQNFSKILL